jgi:hypothetical protein
MLGVEVEAEAEARGSNVRCGDDNFRINQFLVKLGVFALLA